MKIEIPVLVEQETEPGEGGSLYRVRPLFFDNPQRTDRTLSTAAMRLAERLEKQLDALGRQSARFRRLADWSLSPDVRAALALNCGSISAARCSAGTFPSSRSASSTARSPSRRGSTKRGSRSRDCKS